MAAQSVLAQVLKSTSIVFVKCNVLKVYVNKAHHCCPVFYTCCPNIYRLAVKNLVTTYTYVYSHVNLHCEP